MAFDGLSDLLGLGMSANNVAKCEKTKISKEIYWESNRLYFTPMILLRHVQSRLFVFRFREMGAHLSEL